MERKPLEELKAFAEGYLQALIAERDFFELTLTTFDDWVVWGGYDINFTGADYGYEVCNGDLEVHVYPEGWEGELPTPLHRFIV